MFLLYQHRPIVCLERPWRRDEINASTHRTFDYRCEYTRPIQLTRHRVTLVVETMVRLQGVNVISRPFWLLLMPFLSWSILGAAPVVINPL